MQETNNANANESDIHHQMMTMMMMSQQQQEQIDEMDDMMVEDAYQFLPESVTQQTNNNRKPLLFPSLGSFAVDNHSNSSDSNLKATMEVVDAITKTLAAKTKNLQEMIKDKPKRPLSAYNLFFRMERDRILNNEPEREITFEEVAKISVMRRYSDGTKRQHRKTHGKVGFNELTSIISERWKTIPCAIKEMFEERAVVEKTKYVAEIKEWKNSTKQNSKKESTDLANAATLLSTEVSSPTAKAAGGKSKKVTPSRMNVSPLTGSPLLPKLAYATSADGSSLDGSLEPVVISDISESEHHNGYFMSGGNVISDESNSPHDMMMMNSSGAVTLDDPFASSDYDNGNDHEFHNPSMMPTGMMNMNQKMMMPPRRIPNNPTRARLFQQQQRNTTLGGSSRSIMPNKSSKHSRRRHSYAGGATFSPNGTFHNNSTNNMMNMMMMMNNNYNYDAMYDNNIQPILHNALDECDEAFMMAESTLGGDAGVMMMNGDVDDEATNFDQFDEFGNPAGMFGGGSSRMNMNNEMMTMMMMPPPPTTAKRQMMKGRHPGAMLPNKAMMMMSPPTDNVPSSRKRRHSTNGMMSPAFEGFPSFIDIGKMTNPTSTMSTNNKGSDAISNSSEDDANDIQDNLGNKKIKLSHNRRKDLKGEQFSQSIFNDVVDM